MAAVLTAESVSKQFYLQSDRPTTMKESVVRRLTGRHTKARLHWALRDVSFAVEEGHALGIIGHNGAGKSTLLRLICGLGRPTKGRIRRIGHVSALLDLGSGFHPDMTGRENILTGGLLSGMSRRQVLAQQDEIIAFAELEAFIDQPVRTYSSGMYLRLAFATAMQFDPTVLVIDEVLAVGDTRFQQKCLDRLAAFRAAGKTLILTSHVTEQIQALCDEVIVLEEGQLVMQAAPEEALRCYNDLMRQRTDRRAKELGNTQAAQSVAGREGSRQGTQEAQITDIRLYDTTGQSTKSVPSGDGLVVQLSYQLAQPVSDLILSLGLWNENNTKCFETIIPSFQAQFGPLGQQGTISCSFPELPLLAGRYFLNVGLYPTDWAYVYDYHWQMHDIYVTSAENTGLTSGVVALEPVWLDLTVDGNTGAAALLTGEEYV